MDTAEKIKTCPKCKAQKPLSAFPKHGGRCKVCNCVYAKEYRNRSPEEYREQCRQAYHRRKERDPEHNRRHALLKTHGLTLADFDRMLDEQGGVCAICGTDTPGGTWGRFCVDHCHTTGKIRGLLCTDCNVGLGRFRDNPEALCRAADYIVRSR